MPFLSHATAPPGTVPFVPTQIAGCVLWVPVDQLPYSNNASVSVAADFSGLGNNLTQSTSAAQPTFLTNQINGLPAFSFNGSSDYLTCAGLLFNQSPPAGTVFAVFSTPNPTTGFYILTNRTASTGGWVCVINTYVQIQYVEAAQQANSAAVPSSTPCIASYVCNGLNGTSFLNGVPGSPATFAGYSQSTASVSYFGSSVIGNPFNGLIAEVIVYNVVLTTAQRHEVEGYLALKYGIGCAQQ